MNTLLLFGGTGQVGGALQTLAPNDWMIDSPTSREVNLSSATQIAQYIQTRRPSVIVNAAAYTKVDDAETESDVAYAINAAAPQIMAEQAKKLGAHFVHVSTDYVFDGSGTLPYRTDAATHPLNVYGASKLAGELAVINANPDAAIIRTAWVHSGGGVNFIATAVRLLSGGKSMRVVDDQVGTPTRAQHLARALLLLVGRPDISGLLHFTDVGVATWYDVACCVAETLRDAGRLPDGVHVTPVDSSAYPRPAKRPQVSILDTHSTREKIGWTPPHWREGVIASTKELLDA